MVSRSQQDPSSVGAPGGEGGPGDATADAPARARRSVGEERALKLFVVLSRAAQAVEAHARRDVAAHDLSLAEFAVLEVLYHKGPLLLGEVQRKILVSSGGITYLVDRLEAKGLVERQRCPDDRRAWYAALTAEGERLIARIFPGHAQVLERAVGSLSAGEQDQLTALLRTLGRHAAEALREPVP